MPRASSDKSIAAAWGLLSAAILAGLVVVGSRSLARFDAALVGYTFATLFATFAITYRYAMWLRRPPTRLYWRRGWSVFLTPAYLRANIVEAVRRFTLAFAANRFIFRRGRLRGAAHWLIMWGCVLAAAITFPLVWGWIHFETLPGRLDLYRVYVFGFPVQTFPIESAYAFIVFHGLVWAAFLVIAGVMLAFRRRMVDHGAATLQMFAQDILPLVLLFAISVTGLMLTASYTWMKGYAYDFLAILHAITVIVALLYLPFGKLFHIFQRPAQIGVSFYKDAGAGGEQAICRRCARPYAPLMMVRDLIAVERDLGFSYEMPGAGEQGGGAAAGTGVSHYQQICPRCRRALYGLAQGRTWAGGAAVPE
ncbi:MAG: MFS transporter [Acidobacteria bacterium]|nr:MFS transporter [Acidobacteriota bacterium]